MASFERERGRKKMLRFLKLDQERQLIRVLSSLLFCQGLWIMQESCKNTMLWQEHQEILIRSECSSLFRSSLFLFLFIIVVCQEMTYLSAGLQLWVSEFLVVVFFLSAWNLNLKRWTIKTTTRIQLVSLYLKSVLIFHFPNLCLGIACTLLVK